MLDPEYFQQLLKGHLEGSLSPGETSIFLEAVRSGKHRDLLGKDLLQRLETTPSGLADMSPQTREEIIRRILASPAPVIPLTQSNRGRWKVPAAAAAVIIIASVILLYRTVYHASPGGNTPAGGSDIVNTSSGIMPLHLEDGSIIELEPGAHLSYAAPFTGPSRKVRLEGNAFFTIAANPRQPFYVYCRDMVTHVLGTSFHISSQKDDQDKIKIVVRTGKVEVSRSGNDAQPGIVLTPNQQLAYTGGTTHPQPTLVDTPWTITGNPGDRTFAAGDAFRFKATPLYTIFTLIKEKYGIDITMENPALGNNLFTGDLSHETLYTALKLVCLSVNAGYEIRGTKIFINTL